MYAMQTPHRYAMFTPHMYAMITPHMYTVFTTHMYAMFTPDMYVASITNGTTDRQDKYLVSLISTLVASHFNSGYQTIITVYESVSENV